MCIHPYRCAVVLFFCIHNKFLGIRSTDRPPRVMASLGHLPGQSKRSWSCILNPPNLGCFDQPSAYHLWADHTRPQIHTRGSTDSSRHSQKWACAFGIVLPGCVWIWRVCKGGMAVPPGVGRSILGGKWGHRVIIRISQAWGPDCWTSAKENAATCTLHHLFDQLALGADCR